MTPDDLDPEVRSIGIAILLLTCATVSLRDMLCKFSSANFYIHNRS